MSFRMTIEKFRQICESAGIERTEFEKAFRHVPVTEDGTPLALEPRPNGRDVPFVTVPMASKWYWLFVLHPDGRLVKHDFGVLEGFEPKGQPYFVDHVPNPHAVDGWARSMGYYVDDVAMDMLVGRWEIEVVEP